MAGSVKMLLSTFVDTTTMRGFGKLKKTPHRPMKLLWSIYIVSMIALLFVSTFSLVNEYANFHTTVQESESLHDVTQLPSITVCSQSPIGSDAFALWANGSVASPKQLSEQLRVGMLQAFQQNKFSVAKDLFFADKLSTYFQNIPLGYLPLVGMRQEEMILFCLMRHSKNNNPSVSHDESCSMSVRRVRHAQFGNCYDITIDPAESAQVSSVSLVLQTGYLPISFPLLSDSHVNDVFTQSQGLRIALHETGTHPDIDADGISVQLGKLTDIKYQILRHKRLNLPSQRSSCKRDSELRGMKLLDFNEWYDYTYTACISEELGEIILEACGCVSAFHFIDKLPNSSIPFCHFHDPHDTTGLERRLRCVRNVKIPAKLDEIRSTKCAKRCSFDEYRARVSSSDWKPTRWQLEFATSMTRVWDILASADADSPRGLDARRDAVDFMNLRNLSHSHDFPRHLQLDRLSLVTVSRLSYSSINRVETQQITLTALLSRIGGMGSLTIGCTLAFAFELVEFVFTYAERMREKRRMNSRRGQQELRLKANEDGEKQEAEEE